MYDQRMLMQKNSLRDHLSCFLFFKWENWCPRNWWSSLSAWEGKRTQVFSALLHHLACIVQLHIILFIIVWCMYVSFYQLVCKLFQVAFILCICLKELLHKLFNNEEFSWCIMIGWFFFLFECAFDLECLVQCSGSH